MSKKRKLLSREEFGDIWGLSPTKVMWNTELAKGMLVENGQNLLPPQRAMGEWNRGQPFMDCKFRENR